MKKALLIGINYFDTNCQLNGCINDVYAWKQVLETRYGYQSSGIRTLTDERTSVVKPTQQVVMSGIDWLVEGAKPGDSLFFLFSGHGGQIQDQRGTNEELDGKDEVIFCLDKPITDDVMFERFFKRIPKGVRVNCVFDCCHSGTMSDLKYTFTYAAPSQFAMQVNKTPDVLGDVIVFSGCYDSQTSADGTFAGKWIQDPSSGQMIFKWDDCRGAFSYFVNKVLESCNYQTTYDQLLKNTCDILKSNNLTQVSQLSLSRPDMLKSTFVL